MKCLVERLQILNEAIFPPSMIKHLATASNKSHKSNLLNQTKLCPERSMERIMEGVKTYINSDEYNTQKNIEVSQL